MVFEAIGFWLLEMVAEQVFKEGVWLGKTEGERSRRAKEMAAAVSRALETAESDLGDRNAVIESCINLRVAEFLDRCATAIRTGKAVEEPTQKVALSPEKAELLFGPFAKPLLVDVRNGKLAKPMYDSYCEFANDFEHWHNDATDQVAGALLNFFVAFSFRLQEEFLQSFADDSTPAAIARLKNNVAEMKKAIVEQLVQLSETTRRALQIQTSQLKAALGRLDRDDATALGTPIDDPGALLEAAQSYAETLLDRDSRQIELGLNGRIHRLLGKPEVAGDLPSVARSYVASAPRVRGGGSDGIDSTDAQPALVARLRVGDVVPDETSARVAAEGNAAAPGALRFLAHRCFALTGPPGAGKSMELRALARYMAERLRKRGSGPVPVLLRLRKSWRGFAREL